MGLLLNPFLSVRGSEMCNKKRLSLKRAKAILAHAFYQNHILDNKKRNEIRYYWCSKCRAYHLTSKEDINATNRTDGNKSSRATS